MGALARRIGYRNVSKGAIARARQRQVCLVASRRLSVYFDEQGKVIAREEIHPFVQIGGKKFLFDGEKRCAT